MASCPNKSSKAWQDLVSNRGENMAYYLWSKYNGEVPAGVEVVEDPTKSSLPEETVSNIKEVADGMGIKFMTMAKYVEQHPEFKDKGINAVADLIRKTVAVSQGKDSEVITQEVVHIATAILEQTSPDLITSLISKIGNFKIYQETLKKYKNNPDYQTSEGKPNIRKIKKEAIDKLIAEVIVTQNRGDEFYPELADDKTLNWVQQTWEDIKKALRNLYKKAGLDIFKEAAALISSGQVGTETSPLPDERYYDLEEEFVPNAVVDGMYDKVMDINSRMILHPETDSMKRHYTLDGNMIASSVTEKLNKNKDFKHLADNTDKMMWGNEGHLYIQHYIENNLIDEKGYIKENFGTENVDSPLKPKVKQALRSFSENLISSYPEGTRFLIEVQAVNQNEKGGLASTIDFMAFVPTKDSKGNDDIKVDVLDWKFTGLDLNKYEDLSPGKQKAWKNQMGEYVKMLTLPTYGLKREKIDKARMIPFISNYRNKIRGMNTSGLILNSIEVANVTDIGTSELYLLPVPIDSESSGIVEVDNLVNALQVHAQKVYRQFADPEEKWKKGPEMVALQSAIRKLRLQLDFDPLYTVGLNFNKKIKKSLEEFKDLNWIDLNREQREVKLAQLSQYEKSLEKFIDLKNVFNEYLGKDQTKEEGITKRKIENVSSDAQALTNEIIKNRNGAVKALAVQMGETDLDNADDVLAAEVELQGIIQKNFVEGSRMHPRLIRMVSNLMLRASKLVGQVTNTKIKKYNKLLTELEAEASRRGVKAFDLIGEVRENDLKLINKINPNYWKERSVAVADSDKSFFIKNMDVTSYKKEVSEILKRQYKQIDEAIHNLDPEKNEQIKKWQKASLKNKIDIYSDGFYGFNEKFFYKIYLNHFKEENHYSDAFKALKSNKPAYDVWEFFTNLNSEARDLGYLNQEKSTFFPLIEATMLQKLEQTKGLGGQVFDFFRDSFTSRIDESKEYASRDPETGEIIKTIPKYFTKTDKNVEQLSKDLNLVGALWINSIERYKASKQNEYSVLSLLRTQQDKLAIETSGGVTLYSGGQPILKEQEVNKTVMETITDDWLYSIKEDESAGGAVAINFVADKFNQGADEALVEKRGLNIRKSISSMNSLVQLLALGAKITLGSANWFGTQFQTFIKSGEFYTFAEYEANHGRVIASDLGALSDIKKGLLDLFIPLNDDITLEARRKGALKQGYLKYLSTWSFSDTLMLTMQYPEKKLQFANGLSFIENAMVVDGKIVNIRQWLQQQDRIGRKEKSESERRDLRKSFEARVKELKATKSLENIAKFENDEMVIPGVTDEAIGDYRTMMIDYNRTLNGMMDPDDRMGYSRDTLFKSFMMFKSWIPKLVAVRGAGLQKNLQTGNFEYGRMRAFAKTFLFEDMTKENWEKRRTQAFYSRWASMVGNGIGNITAIIKGTDKGLELINKMLEQKKLAYFKKTGQQLQISEEEFQDIIRKLLIDQFKELGVLTTVMGAYIAAAVNEPPEDATKEEINRYKYYHKLINKIGDEVTFYYLPTSADAIMQGTAVPAIGLLKKLNRFTGQLGEQIYGDITDDKEMSKKAHPTKYFLNLFPVLSQWQNEYEPLFFPELSREKGVIVTTESRKN